MQIFNKSKRQFIISTGYLKSGESKTVSESEGAKLIEMYKDEIIQIGDSKVEKENEELKKELAQLKQAKANKKHR